MEPHRIKTLKEIIGKQLNLAALPTKVGNFHGKTHGDIKSIGFTAMFIEK